MRILKSIHQIRKSIFYNALVNIQWIGQENYVLKDSQFLTLSKSDEWNVSPCIPLSHPVKMVCFGPFYLWGGGKLRLQNEYWINIKWYIVWRNVKLCVTDLVSWSMDNSSALEQVVHNFETWCLSKLSVCLDFKILDILGFINPERFFTLKKAFMWHGGHAQNVIDL